MSKPISREGVKFQSLIQKSGKFVIISIAN